MSMSNYFVDFENDEFNDYFTKSIPLKHEENNDDDDDDDDTDQLDDTDQVENDIDDQVENDTHTDNQESKYTPKILVTTSRRPSKPVYEFTNEFTSIFPNSHFVKRAACFEIGKVCELAIERNFTDVIVVNHDRKEPSKICEHSNQRAKRVGCECEALTRATMPTLRCMIARGQRS